MIAVFAVIGVFGIRLVDIQLVRADELNAQSAEKRAQERTVYGVRGDIVDTNGSVLAGSVERYDINASPRVALGMDGGLEAATEHVTEVAAITGGDVTALMTELLDDPESDFMYLAKGVTLEEFRAVMELDIPWVTRDLRPSRVYPNGAIAGNIVGFEGTDGPQAGMELSARDCLDSTNGTTTFERSLDNVMIPGSQITVEEAEDGGTLHLTIDRDLQFAVQQRLIQAAQQLGATWATAIVQRVSDGHLMAVADYPTVDPNHITDPASTGSRAFAIPYEPGSTIKSLTAASLLDAGVAKPTTQITAPGRLYLSDGSFIKDAWAHGDINYTLAGALVNSSNTGISVLSDRLDAESRRDYLVGFGLNDETEVHFDGESEGSVHPVDEWDERTSYNVQFGQGMTTTSVQVASAYQAIANGGVRMPVTLVEGCEQPDGTMTQVPSGEGTRVVSESAANATVAMLEGVVKKNDNFAVPGYRVAVKTGTGEVAENGVYTDKRVISSAGMAPADDPQYVVVVTLGIPGSMYGSSAVATTFRDIMAQTLKTFRVTPSTESAPQIPLTW